MYIYFKLMFLKLKSDDSLGQGVVEGRELWQWCLSLCQMPEWEFEKSGTELGVRSKDFTKLPTQN